MSDGPTGETAEPLGYDDGNWDTPPFLALGQLTTAERMPTEVLRAGPSTIELPIGPPLDVDGMDLDDPLTGRPMSGAQLLDRRLHADGLLVLADGQVRHESYRNSLRPTDRHIVHSCTKSLTTLMVGIAAADGVLDLSAPLGRYLPELASMAAWDGVTVQHALDMATGVHYDEHYEDPDSMYWRYADAVGYYGSTRPGDGEADAAGALGFVVGHLTERAEPPGHRFSYASPVTNLLPMCLRAAYDRPAVELYQQYLYSAIGAEHDALLNCDRFGHPIVEGHLNLSLRDFARWAALVLDDGTNLAGVPVVPPDWIDETCRPSGQHRAAFARSDYAEVFPGAQYRNQTWVLDPEAGRLAMLGIHGQFAYVDRGAGLLIVGLSSYPTQVDPLLIATMTQLWTRITEAIT